LNTENVGLTKATYENVCASAINNCNSEQQCAYVNNISVELIERCINELKLGKASGRDEIGADHLRYAHPSVLLVLKKYLDLCFCMDSFLIALILV